MRAAYARPLCCDSCGHELSDDGACGACQGGSDAPGAAEQFLARTGQLLELRRRLREIAPELEAWTRDRTLPWPGTPREHRDEIRAILAATDQLIAAL